MPGRNDPCPCGSGKKYKKCCWRQDRLAPPKNVNAPAEPDLPAEPAPPEGPPDFLTALTHSASTPAELDAAEDDPLVERANEFWERFMAAPYEDKWNLVATMLAEDPAVCDGEMVFEMTNTLFEQAVDADEPDRLKELLNQLERHAPEAFAEERHYMLEMQGRIALIQQDEAGIARAFDALSPLAGKHLDLYYRLVSALNYHGKLDILHAGLRRARPFIAAADGLVSGAYEEFTEMLGTIELLHRLAENPDLTADDPVLLARFAKYELTLEPKILANRLDYRMRRKRTSCPLAYLAFSHRKKDPAQHRF
ncbi:MAG: SEC-C domain-containing protein, partial [Anaerolineales bacterium]|nr:SEC-C domain-containing protein [Anaerolineales bacterium]